MLFFFFKLNMKSTETTGIQVEAGVQELERVNRRTRPDERVTKGI